MTAAKTALKTDDRPLLTLDEVARRLDVPLATLRYWRAMKSTDLVFMKVGRNLRVHPADFDAYLAARRNA